jgi:aminopeptidase N
VRFIHRTSRATMRALVFTVMIAVPVLGAAQDTASFSHADTVRGSVTPERGWWDAAFYDLHVRVSPRDSSISGWNGITYRVTGAPHEMQIDLRLPLVADSIIQDGKRLTFRRDSDAVLVTMPAPQRAGDQKTVTFYYHGRPPVARHAPWDGGFVWTADSVGNPWVVTAVEGIGASAWWPMKDLWADEPDSQRVAITMPDGMTDVSNGRLRRTVPNGDGTTTWEWFVASPINGYDVTANAGSYAHITDSYAGEGGTLSLDFYPLAIHADTARKQFEQVRPMLQCFEHWFGPYPWYADGYKLVETPHLGMEHQSAVAYGNHYKNGYLGHDLSHTGLGMQWDYIIVHESAHEWWGNNITAKDPADMWIHEAFASYSEGIYTECQRDKMAGAAYLRGLRENIENESPVVGHFGVNNEGSGDMYYKGANMLHTIRQIVNDDEKWRGILRGLNKTFWHQTVTGMQVRSYISAQAGIDLSRVFEQYLTTTRIPVLQYKLSGSTLSYRWANVVPGFDMPVRIATSASDWKVVTPREQWQTTKVAYGLTGRFRADENYYITVENVTGAPATTAAPRSGR